MSNVKEVSKTLTLNLRDIPKESIASAKRDVGDLLIEEILRAVGDGKSPVKSEYWKKLNKEYADEFKGGDRTPTMQLYGDLLDSLEVDINLSGSKIKIGHFEDSGQAPKADGHNQLSTEAKLWASKKEFPKRRYIPNGNQTFKAKIMREVKDILDSYRVVPDEVIEAGGVEDIVTGSGEITEESIGVSIKNMFSDDVINQLIKDAQRRRG
jgi:hypothetical protein